MADDQNLTDATLMDTIRREILDSYDEEIEL